MPLKSIEMTMKNHDYLQINEQNITYEMIDGEVIIIHLEKGHYYSLRGVAATIWDDITKGMTEQMIVANSLAGFRGPCEKIAGAVGHFIAELKKEELIISSTSQPKATTEDSPQSMSSPEKAVFEPPVLVKYTDLEELLLLDPVHEVDESGWPNRRVEK